MSGGIPVESKANNIRLVRGANPKTALVQLIDLSTIAGMRKANGLVIANDVLYIEPIRRPFLDALRNNLRLLGILSGATAVLAFLFRVGSL